MNELARPQAEGLLTAAQLAERRDFVLGTVSISPARRTLEGPAGTTTIEPRIMQVLLVLCDGAGEVVTRDTLFNRCWGGVYVGDDSLNRAIGAARRALGTVGGEVDIETIPRTGYRLTTTETTEQDRPRSPMSTRRGAILAAASAALFGGIGIWWWDRQAEERRFDELMNVGAQPVRNSGQFDLARSRDALEKAVRMRPGNARAWGLLAFAKSPAITGINTSPSVTDFGASEAAARRALAIDPREPNALLAMFELQGATLDWFTRERRLRQILAIDPRHVFAMSELVSLLQSLGMTRESLAWTDRALALEPLSIDLLCRRALKLWIAGRIAEADNLVDEVRGMAPDDHSPWFVRLLILATTGRADAALAMLDSEPSKLGPPQMVGLWRTCLVALKDSTNALKLAAMSAAVSAAKTSGQLAAHAVMLLGALGEADAAYEIIDGFLLWRGPAVRQGHAKASVITADAEWRSNIQWLFTPACASVRADQRFLPLCDDIGLAEYWRRRGVRPDFELTGQRRG